MKNKIKEILLKYRVDFALNGMYTEFGVREEDFDDIAEELSKEFLDIPDVRNKLTPLTHLISMIERNHEKHIKDALPQAKKSINYLAQREVFKMSNEQNIEDSTETFESYESRIVILLNEAKQKLSTQEFESLSESIISYIDDLN